MKCGVIIILSLISVFGFLYYCNFPVQFTFPSLRGRFNAPRLVAQNCTILFWTNFFDWKPLQNWTYSAEKHLLCDCKYTSDRSLLSEARAVVFHLRDVDIEDLPPKTRKDQKWVLYNMESAVNTEGSKRVMQKMDADLDMIITYRRDSDIYAPYAQLIQRKEPAFLRRQVTPDFENKNKSVVWFVSNCETSSLREDFVRHLSHHIDIDIYGHCGSLTCLRSNQTECYRMAEKKYKFYLSFENSICKDYVTEKLFNILEYNLIPVVMGGADYDSLLPYNSYINAFNFSSIELLGKYLKEVASDQKRYNSYFEWKKQWYVRTNWNDPFCQLCQKLVESHEEKTITLYKRDRVRWWYNEAKCVSWYQIGIEP